MRQQFKGDGTSTSQRSVGARFMVNGLLRESGSWVEATSMPRCSNGVCVCVCVCVCVVPFKTCGRREVGCVGEVCA